MKKQIANILSGLRIVLGASLFLFSNVTGGFMVLYIVCGITDLIDGPIARRFDATSAIGALLDTIGDIVTYMALAKILLVKHMVPSWVVIWLLGVAAIHILAGLISLIKVKKFYVVHSLFGKILGGSVFVFPFAMWILAKAVPDYTQSVHFLMAVVAFIGTVAGIESLMIQIKTDNPETSITTIYRLLKPIKED